MSIGVRITEWRKARGLTQAKLAELTQLSASTIAMYETNRRVPDGGALTKLADALQIPVVLLTGQAATPGRSEPDAPVARAQTPPAYERTPDHPLDAPQAVAAPAAVPSGSRTAGTTQLPLTPEEAKIILFLRMNPGSLSFFESYIRSDARQREQLSRTWRLIHDFQRSSS